MTKPTLILLIVFAFVSCKKKTFITIQAENYVTGEGSAYAGAKYYVVESYTPFFQVKAKQVVSGTLDANGHAAFELKMDNNKIYDFRIAVPSNVCYTEMASDIGVNREENNVINFKYGTCGYTRIPFDNVVCASDTDKFQFTYYSSIDPYIYIYRGYVGGEADNYEWSEHSYFEGCETDVLIPRIIQLPIGPYTLDWLVVRGLDSTYGTASFFVNENDTTTYLIEY